MNQRSVINNNQDYTLIFEGIQNTNGSLFFVDHKKEIEGTIGFTINDKEFRYRAIKDCPQIIADLIDLAVSIYATDRLIRQKQSERQCKILVVLPVRCPEFLNSEELIKKLSNLLLWSTGSQWQFIFEQRDSPERFLENPSLPIAPHGSEVALWSGGLDALAGLYTRLQEYPNKRFVLFGAGSNKVVYAIQKKVANAISESFPDRIDLYRLIVHFKDSKIHSKNKSPRARGVVFMLLGSACAYLMGRKELFLYENGIGAINLPYRKSAVGLDHTRSVHPQTLSLVSEFISNLLQERFHIINPFLFSTKAEMCKALSVDSRVDLIQLTKSCDSPHRSRPSQCGYCSSCILRKQALAASHIKDHTLYVVPHGKSPVGDKNVYFLHMQIQVSTIKKLLNHRHSIDNQWKLLTKRFPELDEVLDHVLVKDNFLLSDMQKKLIRLYQNYVDEWKLVDQQISADFIPLADHQQPSQDFQVSIH